MATINGPYQAITESNFNAGTLIKFSDKEMPKYLYDAFHSFADALSYLYSMPEERKNRAFRINRYFNMCEKQLFGACFGRALLVSHLYLHPEHKKIENLKTNPLVPFMQYLFNSITPGKHIPSINNKIVLCQRLFSEMMLGMCPLEDNTVSSPTQIEVLLRKKLTSECQVLGLISDLLERERHATFIVSDDILNKYFLIDQNLQIIQFKSCEDLQVFAPKIIRTFYSKTNEISIEDLKKNQVDLEIFQSCPRLDFKITRYYTFRKVAYRERNEIERQREYAEYTKAIWQLPLEAHFQIDSEIEKIKIQRVINLVTKTLHESTVFQEPFYLSPLTVPGIRERIITSLRSNPFSIERKDHFDIDSFIAKICEFEGNVKEEFFAHVLNELKKKYEGLTTHSEGDEKVKQFQFNSLA